MKINPNNAEIRNQAHEMWAEGCDDDPYTSSEIEDYLNERGYTGNNFDMSFDTMQGLWRWSCDIKPKQNT